MAKEKTLKIQPHKDFPLLEKYKAVFPVNENTAFPYNHVIYTDKPESITPDLLIHEEVHFKQQDEIGLDTWIDNYFNDIAFRIKMELEAYKAQIKYFKDDKNTQDMIRVECAKALSSNLYGNVLTYKEAYSELK